MSTNLEITNTATGKTEKVRMPIESLIKETTVHKGSALWMGLSLTTLGLGCWIMIMVLVVSVDSMQVIILPLSLMLSAWVLATFFLGWGYKGKSLLGYIRRKRPSKIAHDTIF